MKHQKEFTKRLTRTKQMLTKADYLHTQQSTGGLLAFRQETHSGICLSLLGMGLELSYHAKLSLEAMNIGFCEMYCLLLQCSIAFLTQLLTAPWKLENRVLSN
jgi:hypothetical protein